MRSLEAQDELIRLEGVVGEVNSISTSGIPGRFGPRRLKDSLG